MINREMEYFIALFLVLCLIILIQFSEIKHYRSENVELRKRSSPQKSNIVTTSNSVNNSEFLNQTIVKNYFTLKSRQDMAQLLIDTFRDQHIVFVGDSLSRYHYLSFVYTLKHKEAMDPLRVPSIVEQVQWGSWYQFYKGSNKLLAPYELCDCFRPMVIETPENVFENRYYHDPVLNITVTYIQFFSYYAHGHWTPFNNFSLANPPQRHFINPAWRHYLKDVFPRHISLLKHKPSVVVMNVGLWPNKLYDLQYATQVVQSVLETTSLFIWRSTTSKRDEVLTERQKRSDEVMCAFSNVTCMNVSWTVHERGMYLDYVHYKEPVYTKMNEQLAYIVRNSSTFNGQF